VLAHFFFCIPEAFRKRMNPIAEELNRHDQCERHDKSNEHASKTAQACFHHDSLAKEWTGLSDVLRLNILLSTISPGKLAINPAPSPP
jgi:hypothetical protein